MKKMEMGMKYCLYSSREMVCRPRRLCMAKMIIYLYLSGEILIVTLSHKADGAILPMEIT